MTEETKPQEPFDRTFGEPIAADKPRLHRPWKIAARIVAALIIAAVIVVALAPTLIPESKVRQQVTEALERQLGRPVSVDSARFGWTSGLEIRGLVIQAGDGADAPLARANRVSAQFSFTESLAAALGGNPPMDSLRVEGLEVWLVYASDGSGGPAHWNFESLPGAAATAAATGDVAPPPHLIQVTDGIIHIHNKVLGRSLTLNNVHASMGQLETTGQGYISVAANLPAVSPAASSAEALAKAEASAEAGHLHMNAGLDSLDLSGQRQPSGSFHFEWSDLEWSDVAAVITDDPRLIRAAGKTTGQVSATFGHGAWNAEGNVEAWQAALPEVADWAGLTIPSVAVGFQVRQAAESKPVELALLKITAPGVDVKAWGTTRLPTTAIGGPRSVATVAEAKTGRDGPHPSTAGPAALPSSESPPETVATTIDVHVSGHLVWAPLIQSLDPKKSLATWFDTLAGSAEISGRLVGTTEGLRATASADLLHTQAVSERAVHKDEGRPLKVDLDVRVPAGSDKAEITRLELTSDAGHAIARGEVPMRAPDGDLGHRLAGARLDLRADVREARSLLASVPALASRLAPADVYGPMSLRLMLEPVALPVRASRPDEAAATTERGPPPSAPRWTAQLHVDLTSAGVSVPDSSTKRAGTPATLDASVLLDAGARQLRLLALSANLSNSKILWDGAAQINFPEQAAPAARFQGNLRVAKIEDALPILLPTRFDPETAAVAGDAVITLDGSAAGGRLTGKMSADLTTLAIRYRAAGTDYFVKPAGQAASVSLVGSWQPEFVAEERTRHHILAEADLKASGSQLRVFASGIVQADWQMKEAEGDAPRQLVLHSEVLPGSTLELRASVTDAARTLLLAPTLGQVLKNQDIDGAIEAVFVLALRPRVLHVDGSVDLTGAALRLSKPADAAGGDVAAAAKPPARPESPAKTSTATRLPQAVFCKPAGMTAKAALAIDLMPPQTDMLETYLTKANIEFGESTLGATGRVQIVRPGPVAPATIEQVLALFKEGSLTVRSNIHHSPALRQALPCLEGVLYSKADLDGPMTLAIDFSGTAIQGSVHLETDVTACAILHGDAVMKPAGTAATLRLDSRYGLTPGELRIDALELKLADSVVSADARLLFNDPHLLAMQPPSAWSIHVAGRAPDAAVLASLLPSRLGDMKPAGGVTFKIAASGDHAGAELEACNFAFDRARILWLGKACALNGSISYDGQRLATDGLNIVAGQSDVTLVAYIVQPNRAPTGSVIFRGKCLALNELMGLMQETSERVADWAAAAAEPTADKRPATMPLSEELGLSFQRAMAKARLSCEIKLDRFAFTVPDWKATYEPTNVTGEGRLADQRLVFSHLSGGLDGGSFAAQVEVDFRNRVPVLSIAYDANELVMQDNLKPFIETTFPGMTVYGKVSQRNSNTRSLTGNAWPTGQGETVLVDGLLVGPAAPDYITRILPRLAMNEYRFNKMVSKFKDLGNGDVENQMTFYGKEYNVYIFGVSKADGHVNYTAGVDLGLSLGLKESSQPLGKLPMMYYTGRIVGTKFAELNVRYLLPHEFAYESFVRRGLVEQLFMQKGELPPLLQPPSPPPPPPPTPADKATAP
jgi:hypothetical protein